MSKGNKTPSTPAPPAAQGHLGRERQERARAAKKVSHLRSLPRGKVYAGAHRVADRPEQRRRARGYARARGGSRRVCAGAISSLRSGARLLHTSTRTPHRHTSLSLPRTRPRERRPRLPLLSELRRSRRPPSSARPSLCAGTAGARGAGARVPIHLRTTARRARARASLIFHLPEPRALPARGGATAALPITSAPGSARPLPPAPLPPAKLLP